MALLVKHTHDRTSPTSSSLPLQIINMQFKYLCFLSVASAVATTKPACPPFPPTLVEYSSAFQQPKPPLVKPEFKTGFVQHKW